jgi:hypothetical protein
MSFATPGTFEYRLFIVELIIASLALALFLSKKLPMNLVEQFYKFSTWLFGGWFILGGAVDWVLTGNLRFIFSYVFPYVAIPMLVANVMFGYKTWIEFKALQKRNSDWEKANKALMDALDSTCEEENPPPPLAEKMIKEFADTKNPDGTFNW